MLELFQWVRSRTALIVFLGRAQQFRNLRVAQFGMVPQKPGDSVGLVLTLGDRGVARALRALHRQRYVGFFQHQAGFGIGLAAIDLFLGQLFGLDRVDPRHADDDILVRNGLHFQFVQFAEVGNLPEGERRVLDQPDGGRFRHHRPVHHNPPARGWIGRQASAAQAAIPASSRCETLAAGGSRDIGDRSACVQTGGVQIGGVQTGASRQDGRQRRREAGPGSAQQVEGRPLDTDDLEPVVRRPASRTWT